MNERTKRILGIAILGSLLYAATDLVLGTAQEAACGSRIPGHYAWNDGPMPDGWDTWKDGKWPTAKDKQSSDLLKAWIACRQGDADGRARVQQGWLR